MYGIAGLLFARKINLSTLKNSVLRIEPVYDCISDVSVRNVFVFFEK